MSAYSTIRITREAAVATVEKWLADNPERDDLEKVVDVILDRSLLNCRIVASATTSYEYYCCENRNGSEEKPKGKTNCG